MTLFLRDSKNRSILDVECWVKNNYVELSSAINIANYSLLLLSETDKIKQFQLIKDFNVLSELRGWLWEVYFMSKSNVEQEYDNVIKELKVLLKRIGNKYDLHLVID